MSEIFKNLLGGAILTITAFIFGTISLNKKSSKTLSKTVVSIIVVSITYPLIYRLLGGTLSSLIHYSFIAILFTYLFNIKITKAIFMSFIHSILLLISDILIMILMLYVFQINKDYFYNIFVGTVLANLSVSIAFVLFVLIIRKPLKKLFKYNVSSDKLITIFSILSIICIAVFFYIGFSNIKLDNALIISIFGIIVFASILLSLVKQKLDNNKITEKYDSLIEFMKSYEEVIDEQKINHHENKNQLINIKSKLIDKDNSKNIIEYIDSILNEKKVFKKEKYTKLKYLPSNGLRGFFYYKIVHAEELGINVSISISKNVEKSNLHEMNNSSFKQLCKIIGVYLDNAIESSSLTIDKLLGIEVYEIDDDVEIIITNSYIGEIDINNIDRKGYSTKGKSHGYGLTLVTNILKNNTMFESKREITDKLYIQKLIIKNK